MNESVWRYGCLFCRTGAETTVASTINQTLNATEAIAPTRIRRKTIAGKVIEDRVQMLPGYVFFRMKTDESIPRLTRIGHVLKLLEYEHLGWELIGGDREFAGFLFESGLLQPPHVTFVDGRLHFEDGFLYGHDDAVLRVNRRKKTAEVRLEIDRLSFWIGYIEM